MIEYVVIRDTTRTQIGIIDLFASLIWTREYYGTGDFELYCPATPKHVALLKEGHFINRNDDSEIGIIENVTRTMDVENGAMLTARGRFAKCILDRRLIYQLSGNQNRATVIRGNVETAVRNLVTKNIINATDAKRNIDFIKLGTSKGLPQIIVDDNGKSADKQTSYENLLEYTDTVLQEYELGSQMVLRSDKNLYYEIYEGKERPKVKFSEEFDNLISSEYNCDISQDKTTALVGGSGEGLERFYTVFANNYSGMARKEVFVDASSITKEYIDENEVEKTYSDSEYASMLIAQGKQEVAQLEVVQTFNSVVDVSKSQYKYKQHFDIGDKVTVEDKKLGISILARIVKVIEVQDINGYQISVEFTN